MCWKPPRHHLPPPSDFTVRVSSLHHGAAIIEKMPRHVTGSKTSEKTRKNRWFQGIPMKVPLVFYGVTNQKHHIRVSNIVPIYNIYIYDIHYNHPQIHAIPEYPAQKYQSTKISPSRSFRRCFRDVSPQQKWILPPNF